MWHMPTHACCSAGSSVPLSLAPSSMHRPCVVHHALQVYYATGNNYKAPASVLDCINSTTNITKKAQCAAVPGNW